jgi:site-specific DNA recombinase
VTKRSATRRGTVRGGRSFTKASLHFLLCNMTYIGRVKYKGQVYEGQHEAIVSQGLFDQVQALLRDNRRCPTNTNGRPLRGLLQGILYCAACELPMGHTYTCKGNLRYRYYACTRAQKRGWKSCPTGRISAPKVERLVLDELKAHLAESDESLSWPHQDDHQQAMLLRRVVPRVEYLAPNGDLTIHIKTDNILASIEGAGRFDL